MVSNPWATRKVAGVDTPDTPIAEQPEYAPMENSSYAVPSLESGSPYNDEFGWSNKDLRPSTVGYPSAQRLMDIPRKDYRPEPTQPPEVFWDRIDSDEKQRHSVETITAIGWAEQKGISASDKRWSDNPRRTPPAESRNTEQMVPRTYSFTRPFDQDTERRLNGNHFSMADHRRDYSIQHGMSPVRSLRNTYRLEPAPWDMDVVDVPPAASQPYAVNVGQQIPAAPRSWRLM